MPARWDGALIDSAHRPVSLPDIGFLGGFELIDCPEDRQPAIAICRGQAGEMRGVYYQHSVKLEPYWTRLNVADARQEKCREHLAIAKAFVNSRGHLFENPLARGVLE